MKKPDLATIFQEGIPDERLLEVQAAVSAPGLDVVVEKRPAGGPYTGVEWFIPTAIIFFIGKSYLDGFLRKAGRDHYQLLKAKLFKTATQTMQAPRIEPVIFGAKGRVRQDNPYSVALSIYAEANDGNILELLLPKSSHQPDYEQIISEFLDFLSNYHGDLQPSCPNSCT